MPTNAEEHLLGHLDAYDAEGRQTGCGRTTCSSDGVNEAVGTFAYDSDGLLVEQHDDYEPSTASDWSTYTTRWEYDERGSAHEVRDDWGVVER
jgi:YD repeat-containing protein